MMKRLIIFLFFVVSVSCSVNAANNAKQNCGNESKNWETYSNAELMQSIKADAAKMSAKMKILSDRYYCKAKDAANSGKEEVAETYKSCANSLKEMGEGLDEHKTELIAKGKNAYIKAKAKIKPITEFSNVHSYFLNYSYSWIIYNKNYQKAIRLHKISIPKRCNSYLSYRTACGIKRQQHLIDIQSSSRKTNDIAI